jgi:pyruvate kinase
MVARGDLGVETAVESVPFHQKQIIAAGQRGRKACHYCDADARVDDSRARPTRAEASDVANAILDGTDAVMLSG